VDRYPTGMLSRHKVGSSLCHVRLPSSVLNSNFFTTEFPLRLAQRRYKINTKKLKKHISRYGLAIKYQKMVNNPKIGSRAALSRKLGVSRAWVTIVMRELGEKFWFKSIIDRHLYACVVSKTN